MVGGLLVGVLAGLFWPAANLAVTTTVARLEGKLDEARYRAPPGSWPAAAARLRILLGAT